MLALTGCGSADPARTGDADASASSSPATTPGVDLADPGDDLLHAPRRGVELAGVEQKVSWRFPEAYEPSARQATLSAGGVDYELTVGAPPDSDQRSEGERFAEDAGPGVIAAAEDVSVAGRTFTLATFDQPDTSLRAFFLTPENEQATYAVLLRAGTSLEDTPPERLAEVYQMVASLELEAKQGFDSAR